jgi:hypothetical protein
MKFAYGAGLALTCLMLAPGAWGAEKPPKGALDSYDPATSARIRVFGGGGYSVSLAPDASCYRSRWATWLSSLGERPDDAPQLLIPTAKNGLLFNAILNRGKNVSIGMPASAYSAGISHGLPLLGQVYFYIEYAVPAGVPIVLIDGYELPGTTVTGGGMTITTQSRSCRAAAVRLVPEAGKNYEVRNSYQDYRCDPAFVQLPDDSGPTADGAKLTLPEVPACPS